MNATKFVVLLIFVGVVCANVGARQLEEVSGETIFGAELDSVTARTDAINSENSNADAAAGPRSASASGSVFKYTSGSVTAEGPNASASSGSGAFGDTGANAAAGPYDAEGSAYAFGSAGSYAGGSTSRP